MEININVVRLWVNNLRAGLYRQATGRLRSNENEFCCLGVLCDLVEPGNWDRATGNRHVWSHRSSNSMPSRNVADYIGLDNDLFRTLSNKNDNGESFNEIADYIEERILK